MTTAFKPLVDHAQHPPHKCTTTVHHLHWKIYWQSPDPPPNFPIATREAKAANQHAHNASDTTHMQSTDAAQKNSGMDLPCSAGTTRKDASSTPRAWSSAQTGSDLLVAIVHTAQPSMNALVVESSDTVFRLALMCRKSRALTPYIPEAWE